MSEWHVEVVRVGPVRKHPAADRLEIVNVHAAPDGSGGYPCIVRTGEFREGDMAIYVPVDSEVPVLGDTPFAFLKKDDNRPRERVRALRLRGIFSMGLLVPAPVAAAVGTNLADALGVTKWDPPETFTGGDSIRPPSPYPFPTYDVDALRRNPGILLPDEDVVITEKIHGTNARCGWVGDTFAVGSHTQFKDPAGDSTWAKVAREYDLAVRLAGTHLGLYYEVYGPVQGRTFNYGSPNVCKLAVFDVLDLESRKWLDYDDARAFVTSRGLAWVPVLYEGQWSDGLVSLAEGPTTLGGGPHVREGIVIRPFVERFDKRLGRVQLKYHGQGFLLKH